MIRTGLALLLLIAAALPGQAQQPVSQDWLDSTVEDVRETHDLIALGAAVIGIDGDPVVAVSGTVTIKSDTPVSPQDAWHIGSNTKALTALLYARLVEDGQAEWGATLDELFPGMTEMDAGWSDVTVEDLFAHRSGVGQTGPFWIMARRADDAPVREQRLKTTQDRLRKPPGEIGEFEYSNLNYIIAGAAIEMLLDMDWEDAMRAYVLNVPGGEWSEGWGFGPPQTGPQGHGPGMFGGLVPKGRGVGADNPQALGPAGTMHAPLGSHVRLLREFLRDDSELVTPQMRTLLLEPRPDESAQYALGWGVATRGGYDVRIHQGSNTMWLSTAVLIPSLQAAILINTNEMTDKSQAASIDLLEAIEQRLIAGD